MQELDLLFGGKVCAVVTTRNKIPNKAIYWKEDHLNVEYWAYTNVQLYISSSAKKGTKYYAIVKDERKLMNENN